MAERRKKSEPVNESAERGQAADSGIYLDPKLAEARDAEAERLAQVVVDGSREEPSLDPKLAEARDAEAKRLAEQG